MRAGGNKWNFSPRRAESLSTADADCRNQLMLESPSHSDGDLLRLLSAGDETAFLEFYRRHQGVVYRFALQMSGKTDIAEEVTQDVFMVVMGAGARYDSERGSVAAFLYGIARNIVLRALERERPYITVLDDSDSDYANRLTVEHQDLPGKLARNERIATLRKAVLALPPAREACPHNLTPTTSTLMQLALGEKSVESHPVALECRLDLRQQQLDRL